MSVRRVAAPLFLTVLCSCSGPAASPAVTPSASATQTAAATPSAVPTATASAGPPSAGAGPAAASVQIGSGFSDVSPHQLVRTSGNVVYAAAPTCPTFQTCDGNALVMSEGNAPGMPVSFSAVDAAAQPHAANTSDAIGTSAMAIDGHDLIWVAWIARANGGTVQVATFDTAQNTWSSPTVLATTGNMGFYQGAEGVALALDASGAPHVAYTAFDSGGTSHVVYSNHVSGSWSSPVRVDTENIPSGDGAAHPTIAFAGDGSLLFAWLDGTGEYNPGTIHTRVRSASGAFGTTTLIAGQAQFTVDNGPSLMVTSDGTRHLTFVDTNDVVKYWYGPDGSTWHGDRQPPAQVSHDPSLGPDGAGGVYIYGHGTPEPQISGTGQNLYRFHLSPGSTAWSPFALYVTGTYDCSVSTRWSQFFMQNPAQLDVLYWDASRVPNELYLGEG